MNSPFNTRMWGKPILLGILSITGLVAALVGDGIWDVYSWIALGVPVYYMVKYLFFQKAG